MPERRRLIVGAVVVVISVAAVVALGVRNPPRDGAVVTDRLGPEQGEHVSDYLSRAAESLRASGGRRYALAALTTEVTPTMLLL